MEKVLNSGRKGIEIERLKDLFEKNTEGVIKAAIDRLKKENQVRELNGKLFSKGAARIEKEAYKNSEIHEFFVEKVRQGNAILKVDGKWRAVLGPEDYEGPRNLIKKGKKFKGVADLYKDGKIFRVWIKDVVER